MTKLSNRFEVEMLENEYWWGGCSYDGPEMPYSIDTSFKRSLYPNETANQAAPLLLSNKGRYIWCEDGFFLNFKDGFIILEYVKSKPQLYENFKNLRDAFLNAAKTHFPASGKSPASLFFERPQYNTWIELMYNQNQQDILKYAEDIIKNGLPSGILMIDDGWAEYYGKWDFHPKHFPDPKSMVEKLHELGFNVMLWTCPFISCDSIEYRYLKDKKYLVFDKNGNPSIKQWWNGFSAVLDFTNPNAVAWYAEQNQLLLNQYGIDGFKLDAGDASFYSEHDVTFAPIDANGQSELWAKFGLKYEYNEYRACFKCGGQALVQRLCDKQHSWDKFGIGSLVPSELAQGILGFAYSCPDMIGGGEYLSFLKNSRKLDQELFVRYAQCAALMPMMQFSAAPWRILDEEHFDLCKKAAWLHIKLANIIAELVKNAEKTGEPIVRYLEYTFPNNDLEKINDQFMLGDSIMVAPVLKKRSNTRSVVFPIGKWLGDDGTIVEGPCTQVVNAPLSRLPIYKKL